MELASIENGAIVIRLDSAALVSATEACPKLEYFDTGKQDFLDVKVTDPAEWMRSVCRELNRESEDGTTLVHIMFDDAMLAACEAGEEGMDIEAPHPVEPEA